MKEEKSNTTHFHIPLSSKFFFYSLEGAQDMRLFKTLLNEPIIPVIVMETVNQEVNPVLVEDT